MGATNDIFKVTNFPDWRKQLRGLDYAITIPIIQDGFKRAAEEINREAMTRLNATKKGKSKSNYAVYSTAFVSGQIMNKKTGKPIGYRAGVRANRGKDDTVYKIRWKEWGTKKRQAVDKKGDKSVVRNTGAIEETNFFYNSVKAKMTSTKAIIIKAFETAIRKASGE